MDSSSSSSEHNFHDFVARICNPASADLVRSIKRIYNFVLYQSIEGCCHGPISEIGFHSHY